MKTLTIRLAFFHITFVTVAYQSWQSLSVTTWSSPSPELELCMGRVKMYLTAGQPSAA